jgi:hypothetical protein
MKKLVTIVGAFLFASVVLTSCGGESDTESIDVLEFLDNAHLYKGYEISFPLYYSEITPLREALNNQSEFCSSFRDVVTGQSQLTLCFNSDFGPTQNIQFMNPVYVTFLCNEGSTTSGNEVLLIERN